MPTGTVTSKGQITIPKPIRTALGLKTGDRLSFTLLDDGSIELRPRSSDLLALFGRFGSHTHGVTLEEMEEGIARGATGADGDDDR